MPSSARAGHCGAFLALAFVRGKCHDPAMVSESSQDHAPGTAGEGQLRDGVLYFVRSRDGEINVARYIERHRLFFAVGDSIGYFPGDLTVGNPVPLDRAFE